MKLAKEMFERLAQIEAWREGVAVENLMQRLPPDSPRGADSPGYGGGHRSSDDEELVQAVLQLPTSEELDNAGENHDDLLTEICMWINYACRCGRLAQQAAELPHSHRRAITEFLIKSDAVQAPGKPRKNRSLGIGFRLFSRSRQNSGAEGGGQVDPAGGADELAGGRRVLHLVAEIDGWFDGWSAGDQSALSRALAKSPSSTPSAEKPVTPSSGRDHDAVARLSEAVCSQKVPACG